MEKQLSSAAIICEYNPFHHGHAHQIATVKREFDLVVGIMSGAFVQRGYPAVADKYSRAAAALEGGMDLVLELPFPFCCAAAPDFAAAGVYIANAIGVNALAFGCEDKGETVQGIARLLATGTLKKEAEGLIEAQKSLSYPRALQLAAEKLLGKAAAEAISKPNNILGAEYMAAIYRGGYALTPYPVQRDARFLSSTAIRENGDFAALLPYPKYFTSERRDMAFAERLILNCLRTAEGCDFYGVDKSLAAKLKSSAKAAHSVEEAIQLTTDKVYTAARVRRAVIATWLGISKAQLKEKPAYTSLLAANEKGTAFLKAIKHTASIPIITKPAAYKKHPDIVSAFEKALAAEEAAILCCPEIKPYGTALKATPTLLTSFASE